MKKYSTTIRLVISMKVWLPYAVIANGDLLTPPVERLCPVSMTPSMIFTKVWRGSNWIQAER